MDWRSVRILVDVCSRQYDRQSSANKKCDFRVGLGSSAPHQCATAADCRGKTTLALDTRDITSRQSAVAGCRAILKQYNDKEKKYRAHRRYIFKNSQVHSHLSVGRQFAWNQLVLHCLDRKLLFELCAERVCMLIARKGHRTSPN